VKVGAAGAAGAAAVAALVSGLAPVADAVAPVEGGAGVFFPTDSSFFPHPPLATSTSVPAVAHPMILLSSIRRG
jgi:hypothetical protein